MFRPLRALALALAAVFATMSLVRANVQPAPTNLSLSPDEFTDPPAFDLSRHKLTLHPPEPVFPDERFTLGSQHLLHPSAHNDATLRFSRLPWQRDESAFILDRLTPPDWLEKLGNQIDVDETERPWSTTTTVHFLASEPKIGEFVPFFTLAHELDVNEDITRIGFGAGAMIRLDKDISFGSEIIFLNSDQTRAISNDSFSSEALFLTRLQISF